MADVPSPRDYQRKGLNNIYELYPNENRLGIFWATGLGKGMTPLWLYQMYPDLVRRHGMLFIADRRKLIFQAYERFVEAFGDDLWVAREMAEFEATGREDVIFMSAPSVGRIDQERIKKYRHRHFGIVQVDEAHRLETDTKWDRILSFFGVGSDSSTHYTIDTKDGERPPLAVHYTATPTPTMRPFVDKTAHTMSVLEGIRQGWLTDVKSYHAQGVRDVQGMCRAYQKYLQGERVLTFAASVDESKRFTEMLNVQGIVNAAHIDAETPTSRREDIYDAFEAGVINCLNQRLIAVEGVDLPHLTAMLHNAPPSSERVYTQEIGRALRPHPTAEVDKYDTAEERKEEIRRSEKPFALLVCCFDPQAQSVTLEQALTGQDINLQADGDLVVEEVIDVLEEYEEERPEVDLTQFDSLEDIEIEVRESDIFRRTIYNEDLQSFSKLNWIIEDSTASLWLPQNPFTSKWKYKACNTVLQIRDKDKSSCERRIISGGWNGQFPAAVKATRWKRRPRRWWEEMKKFEEFLKSKDRGLYYKVTRKGSEQASDKQIEYLRQKGIPVNGNLTEESARLLKDRERIKNKVDKVN